MSTNDVPGAVAANNDTLGMGCWAENDDGSLVLVESTEANRVIFSVFDMSRDPIMEYRSAMPDGDFKRYFSWTVPGAKKKAKWTWHDKTAFPWDRIIKEGAKPGVKYASAGDQLNAAQRVAEDLKMKGGAFDPSEFEGLGPREISRKMIARLQKMFDDLPE